MQDKRIFLLHLRPGQGKEKMLVAFLKQHQTHQRMGFDFVVAWFAVVVFHIHVKLLNSFFIQPRIPDLFFVTHSLCYFLEDLLCPCPPPVLPVSFYPPYQSLCFILSPWSPTTRTMSCHGFPSFLLLCKSISHATCLHVCARREVHSICVPHFL